MTKVVTHDLYLILFSGDFSCNLLWSVSSKQCNEVKVQLCIFSKLQITFPSAVQQIFSCEAREDTFPISHSWAWKEILKMDFNTFFASNKSHLASRSKHIMLTKKNDIFHQISNKQSWRPIFQLWDVKICEPILNCEKAILSWQRDNFQRWKGHFMLVSDYQNQHHLQNGE